MAVAQAGTVAGTVITNTAAATYLDGASGPNVRLSSNTARTVVQPLEALQLTAPESANRTPGSTFSLPHVLTNMGNVTTVYAVTVAVAGGSFAPGAIEVVEDMNGNGVADPGEPVLPAGGVLSLAPGAAMNLIVAGQVPVTASAGQLAQLRLTAVSQVQGATASNLDTIAVIGGAVVTVVKNASVAAAAPGETFSYTLVAQNSGSAAADPVPVTIDGAAVTAVVLRDAVPANTTFGSLSSPTSGARLLYHQLGTPAGAYSDAAPPAATVDAVAVAVPQLLANATLSAVLTVTAHGNASGTLSNTAYTDFVSGGNATTVSSNAVQLTLPALAPTLNFYTTSTYANPAQQAALGAPLYVQINAAQCNTDPTAVLTHPVTLVSALTGDTERFTAVETAANTGVFRIQPDVPTAGAATHVVSSGDGILEVLPDDHITATLTGCGAATATATLLVDPSGVLYNSKTNQAVSGATVQLIDVTGVGNGGHPGGPATVFQSDGVSPAPSSVATGSDGRFGFPFVPASTYRLAVTPPNGYVFPSKLPPALQPAGRNVSAAASYGASFVVTASGAIMIDIPVDTGAAGGLFIQKVASKTTAALGDFVDYTVTITDNTGLNLGAAVLDDALPAGFIYVKDSARWNGAALGEPSGGLGPALKFSLGVIAPGTPSILTYRVHVGPGAENGSGTNTAQLLSGLTTSNIATAHVQIDGGVLSTKGYLIGKVYADCNHDRIQEADEPGIPGVRIYLDNGTYAVTDEAGKYSLYGLTPRTYVAKLDSTTLPTSTHLEVLGNRNAGDAGSQFVDLKNGELHKADFAIADCGLDVETKIEARGDAMKGRSPEITRAAVERLDLNPAPAADARALPAAGVLGAPAAGSSGNDPLRSTNPMPGAPPSATPSSATPSSATPSSATPSSATPSSASTSTPSASPPSASTPVAALAATVAAAAPESFEHMLRRVSPEPGFVDLVEGQILPMRQTRVRVKGPLDTQLRLSVNGEEVALTQVGEQSRLESRGVSAWEYVGIALQSGNNELTLQVADSFGNVRATERIHVIAPGDLAELKVTVPATANADSDVPVQVTVALLDAHGVPVTARTELTLESTLGEWQTPDLDPKEPGTQVFVDGGVGHFLLMPPKTPAQGRIKVTSSVVTGNAELTFVPNLRPMIAAGILEGTIGVHSLNPNSLVAGQGTSIFERDLEANAFSFGDGKDGGAAAASVFVKGEIPGSNLLTVSFDSDKPSDTPLLRDIQPDRFYPVYGDSSIKGFDAQATSKLYTRIDHGTSYVLFGDFSTQSDNQARVLTQYNRVLNGAKTHIEDGNYTVDAFVSDTNTTQVIDEIPANGTSGPYHLSQLNVVLNSPQVQIITRDRNQPSIVLAVQSLAQFTDYAVEPEFGEILFKAPIPSLDPNLNPIYIRVTYEVSNGGPNYWVGGLDMRDKITHSLTLGGTYINDSNAADRQTLDGLSALWQPEAATSVAGEVAESHSDLAGSGNARRVELKHNDPKLQVKAYAVQTDPTFNNPNSTYTAGASSYGAKVGYSIDASDRVSVDALKNTTSGALIQAPSSIPLVGLPSTIPGGASQNGENVAVERNVTKTVKVTVGVRHVDANAIPTQPLAIGAVPDEFTSARVRVDAPVPDVPKAAAFAQFEEALDSTGREATTVGGTYQLAAQSKVYVTHETSDSLSGSYGLSTTQQNYSSVVGIDTTYMKDGQLFNEYRVGDGIDGRSDEAAVGLRNTWHLEPGLALITSLQQIHPISGVVTNQATALAAGLEYTANPLWKGSTRVEWSESSTAQTWLTSAALAAKLDDDNTILAREVYNEQINTGPTATGIHLEQVQWGLATRPVTSDVWNALALIEYKRSANSTLGAGLDTNERAYIVSTHWNVQPSADWVVNARYGVKWATDYADEESTTGLVQLIGARSVWDLDAHWDAGIQAYTEIAPMGLGGRQLALGGEVGYLIVKNLWFSAGYNVVGFRDPDLAGDDYTQRSFYVRLRFKFDENLFKPRNNADEIPASVPIPP
jgi:uncharacterized repeat protein (TIGR01451 family)